jgi:uncharacterized membrane protein
MVGVILLLLSLFILTIITLIQVSSLKNRIKKPDAEILGLHDLLAKLEEEIKALIQLAKSARADTMDTRPEQPMAEIPSTPAHKPVSPPPTPMEPAYPAQSEKRESLPTAAPVIEPKELSPFAEAVHDILKKIWSWILVGEEYRQAGMTMEFAVATTWLMRAGIIACVAFVAYFLKWSIAHELIGPPGRVAIAIFFGLGMMTGGIRLINRQWSILGQGFIGGGLATLYLGMYAAGPLYSLLPSSAVFAIMIMITLTAGLLAVRTKSMLVAIFGIVGGFCTPILLRTGQPQFLVLYSYLLLLNFGILGIAHYRQWRLLNYLGFIFTYVLFFASLSQYQRSDFPVAITFLSLFFTAQSLTVILYNIRRAVRTTLLETIHLTLNAAVFSIGAYDLIRDAVGRPYPALMTLALAVFYMFQVFWFLRRRREDRPLLVSLIALAGFYTTLTMPLVMEKESLTICWSLLAFMFVWLGGRLNSHFLRHLGFTVYGIVFFRLLFLDMPRNFSVMPTAVTPLVVYGKALVGRLWTFGVAIISTAAAFLVERRQAATTGSEVTGKPRGFVLQANDTPDFIPSSLAGPILFWVAVLVAFIFMQLECYAFLVYFVPLRPALSTILWCGLAAYCLIRYISSKNTVILAGLFVLAGAAIIKTFFFDFDSWQICDDYYFKAAYTPLVVFMRWLDFAAVLGLLFAAWSLMGRRSSEPQVFGYAGLALLFIYLSLEMNSLLFWKLREFQAGGISILWALFAAAFIGGGIWKQVRPLRFIGLILFAVIVVKVFLVDLAHMPIIFRAVAFLVVGLLLLLGAFAYLYASRQFKKTDSSQ